MGAGRGRGRRLIRVGKGPKEFLVADGLQGDCGWSGVGDCYAQGELAGLGFLAAAAGLFGRKPRSNPVTADPSPSPASSTIPFRRRLRSTSTRSYRKSFVFREAPQLGDSKQTVCQSVRDVEQRVEGLEGYVAGMGAEFVAETEDEVEGEVAGEIEDWVAGFELGLDANGMGGGACVCACVVGGGKFSRGLAGSVDMECESLRASLFILGVWEGEISHMCA
jgi:hypothetical protein